MKGTFAEKHGVGPPEAIHKFNLNLQNSIKWKMEKEERKEQIQGLASHNLSEV